MNILVVGGSGYIGARLVATLGARAGWQVQAASRHGGAHGLRLDTRDEAALTRALRGVDAVVHGVAGSASTIAEGARVLARSARAAGTPRVVYLSSMAVYGERSGPVNESSPWGRSRGWYARAKQSAERSLREFAQACGDAPGTPRVTVLRPGCVWGPGSALWVERIARWLAQGRLGDLGAAGDGWTHGVTVDDVCLAIESALVRQPPETASPGVRTYNLAAPDSPRWNDWFTDLALALGHTPLRRIRPLQLRADAWLLGPPLQAAHVLGRRLGESRARAPGDRFRGAAGLPQPISPGLLRLWQSTLRMDASAATRDLGLRWTPYPEALRQCVASLTAGCAPAAGAGPASPAAARAR